MKLNSSQQAFIALVKAGLWNKEVRLLQYKAIDFNEVLRIAEQQSVVGLLAAGIEHVQDFRVPQTDVLTIAGRALQIEQQNMAMNQFVADLFANLRKENIDALLVKGQGIAQCFEKPMWRACGDVDLLLDAENYERAKKVLLPLAVSVESEYKTFKHLGMTMSNGVEVELHGTMHTRLSKRVDSYIDRVQEDTFNNHKVRTWQCGDTEVSIPAPDNDVIFLFTHILHHFYLEGIGLRQICDWCRFLWTYQKELDVALLETRLCTMGLLSEWKTFAALAVDWLGMPADAMPLYSPSKLWIRKANKIMAFVIKTGNFGHNRQRKRFDNYHIGKVQSAWHQMKDFVGHTLVFPMDSIKFFFNFIYSGIEVVVNQE